MGDFLDFCTNDFSKLLANYELKHWKLFAEDKIYLSINSVSIPVRFHIARWME